jgi:hypothetical protein
MNWYLVFILALIIYGTFVTIDSLRQRWRIAELKFDLEMAERSLRRYRRLETTAMWKAAGPAMLELVKQFVPVFSEVKERRSDRILEEDEIE